MLVSKLVWMFQKKAFYCHGDEKADDGYDDGDDGNDGDDGDINDEDDDECLGHF